MNKSVTTKPDFAMWNSRQLFSSGLFHSVRLLTIQGMKDERDLNGIIKINMKVLVRSTNSLSEGYFVEEASNLNQLESNIRTMFEISRTNATEKAALFESGLSKFASWFRENNNVPNSEITPFMFTVIGF